METTTPTSAPTPTSTSAPTITLESVMLSLTSHVAKRVSELVEHKREMIKIVLAETPPKEILRTLRRYMLTVQSECTPYDDTSIDLLKWTDEDYELFQRFLTITVKPLTEMIALFAIIGTAIKSDFSDDEKVDAIMNALL